MKSKDKKASRTNIGIGKDKEMTVTDDPRFSKVLTDPRFKKVPKRVSKVSIDSRFNEVFTDKRFATSSAKVDKRGKLTNNTDNALQMYYHKEDEEDDVKTKKKKSKSKDDLSLSDPESSSESAELKSESDDDSVSTTDDEADDADMVADDDSDVSEEVENVPVIDKETHRLAVVNMDWNQVKAVDLFMMLRSFLPKGGQIKSVAVYPSEFGLKRMEEEALRGPIALLEGEKKKKDRVDVEEKDDADENKEIDEEEEEEEDEDEDEDDNDNDDDEDEELDSSEEEDNDEIDIAKLRAYERSKLRYYYAVVECDSIATADYLYKACDGVEFERSSNVLDLRFIPDSMKFPHPPRDVANEAPSAYEGLDFQTRALQQSNVTLSWDDDEPHRVKTLRRNFNEKQLAELELKEFLASDESESDEDGSGCESDSDGDNGEGDEEDQDPSNSGNMKTKKSKVKAKKAEMYRALLQSGDSEEDENEGQDMEVTFNSGLEDISKKILEKKDKGSETVWEAYLRKKKEKKKARKFRSKNSSDDESDDSDQEPLDQPDDFFEDEPSAKSKKATRVKKMREEKRPLEDEARVATAAELELLLADEKGAENNLKGYKIKMKKVKGKKDKEAIDEEKLPTIDYDDPRFSALFSNPGFALDPTDPQFKRSATYFRQLAQRHENNRNGDAEKVPEEPSQPIINNSVIDDENPQVKSRKEKFELSSIVKGIKLKSQMIPKPCSSKTKTDKMKHGSSVNGKKHKLEVLDRKIVKKSKASK